MYSMDVPEFSFRLPAIHSGAKRVWISFINANFSYTGEKCDLQRPRITIKNVLRSRKFCYRFYKI